LSRPRIYPCRGIFDVKGTFLFVILSNIGKGARYRGDALKPKSPAAVAGSVNNKKGGRMRTRFVSTTLAWWTCVAVFSAAVACAQTPCPSGEGELGYKGKGFDKHLKALNLTPAQQTQLDTQRAAQREAMKSIHQSVGAKRQELRAEIDKEKTDQAKIDSIAAELKNLEGQRIDQEIKGTLQIKTVLTPDQFKQLSAKRGDRKHGKHGWWKKHPNPQTPSAGESSSAAPVSGGTASNN
jgi:Spy/CpxP family protein refolding chaperone